MSTFLSRVAARAVGAQASARPRPAARYESEPGSALVEIADDLVSSRPASPARPRGTRSPAPPGPDARAPWALPMPRGAEQDAEPHPPAAERGIERIESWHHAVEVVTERVETTPPWSPAAPVGPAAIIDPGAEIPPPPAAPPAIAAPNAAFGHLQLPPMRAAAEERPEVRVHIGRLEVRANLQPAPPPRRREPEPAPELSLTDYLRRSRRP